VAARPTDRFNGVIGAELDSIAYPLAFLIANSTRRSDKGLIFIDLSDFF
jgi:hypothetical protein